MFPKVESGTRADVPKVELGERVKGCGEGGGWATTYKCTCKPPKARTHEYHTLPIVPFTSLLSIPGVNMKGVNLENSQMAGVNLRVATLKNANLQNSNLRWAVLAGTDLEVSF